jgi:biopolymer transport protein ExbD
VQFRRPGRPRVGIDIAPLVDVVFLLVIFFAVSTTFLETSGLKLELPRSTATAEREVREIAVLLAADGALAFEGEPVTTDRLRTLLEERLNEAERKIVVLRADTGTPHGKVVEIMDLIRSSGAEGMTVATRAAGS